MNRLRVEIRSVLSAGLACLFLYIADFGGGKAHAYRSGSLRTFCTQHGGTFVCTPVEFGPWTAGSFTCAGPPVTGDTPDAAFAAIVAKVNSSPACIAAGIQLTIPAPCNSDTYFVEDPFFDLVNARFLVDCTYLLNNPGGAPTLHTSRVSSMVACPHGRFAFDNVALFINHAPTYCIYFDNPKILGAPDCCVGNPIDPRTGSKFQVETDLRSASLFGAQFIRYYGNFVAKTGPLGAGWRHHYERRIVDDVSGPVRVALAFRPDGKVIQFRVSGQAFISDSDVSDRLERLTSGWRYLSAEGDEAELYDNTGRLLSISNRNGLVQSLAYDSQGRLDRVTDAFGRSLTFGYSEAGRLVSMTDPAGGVYTYAYSLDGRNNLLRVTYPSPQGSEIARVYHYENVVYPNLLTGITDENGDRFATFSYDAAGLAASTEHAGGAGKVALGAIPAAVVGVTEFVDSNPPLSVTRSYQFSTVTGAKKLTGIAGQPCVHCGPRTTQYNSNGFVSRTTDWNGNATVYNRNDPFGRRDLETQRIEASGTSEQRTISTEWHPTFRLPVRIAEPLRITTFAYNGDSGVTCGLLPNGAPVAGVLCSKTTQPTSDVNGSAGFSAAPAGAPRTWAYTYDANGSLLTLDGPRTDVSDITTYSYYANDDPDIGKRGNVATIRNALGHLTSVTAYHATGVPLAIVDPNGLTTNLAYDERQRLKSREMGGEVTSYDYDGVGQLTKVTLPDGSFLSYAYDAAHRLIGMQDNLGNRISYALDLKGNRKLEQVFDPANQLAQTRSRVFDNLNRLVKELGSQNQATQYTYDDQGNLRSITDPLLRVTVNEYDARNRLSHVTDAALGITRYAYNGLDALAQVTDPRNLVTAYTVDGLGNLNVQSSPDTGITMHAYDAAGNLLTRIDARNLRTTHVYDALGRLTLSTSNNGARQIYAYDQGANGIGRLSSITEINATNQVVASIAYTYDLHGRVLSELRTIMGAPFTMVYAYDSFGRLSSLTYPSGRSVSYAFDPIGRVGQVTTTRDGVTQTVVHAVDYHPFGGVKTYTFGNGQAHTRAMDLDGRVSSYTLGSETYAIGYDAASRIAFISDLGNPVNSKTYGYDNLDRLTSAVVPGTPYAYGYDAVGNRIFATAGAATTHYTYSPSSNRMASVIPPNGPARTISFNANGSTTADGINAYNYSVRERLNQAISSLGVTNYQLNILGQRIRKVNSVEETFFHYDHAGRLIAETDGAGTFKREYIYLGDIPVAVFQ